MYYLLGDLKKHNWPIDITLENEKYKRLILKKPD